MAMYGNVKKQQRKINETQYNPGSVKISQFFYIDVLAQKIKECTVSQHVLKQVLDLNKRLKLTKD